MKPIRGWHLGVVVAFLAGVGLGLVYAWTISPPRIADTDPAALRADFKDQYRASIAAAYSATGNLPRARARLALLGDPDPIEALNAQAQRMLASGTAGANADQLAKLALALDDERIGAPLPTPTTAMVEAAENPEEIVTAILPPPPSEVPIGPTEMPEIIETAPAEPVAAATPRPTRTLIPTLGAPFALTGQESICDSNLPDGLLQVLVLNANRRQLAGVEIVVTWDGGKEQFFTGLKPELGNGYADYLMTPDETYVIQLARGSDVALGITAPVCQTASGENFLGAIKLTFQQP